MPFMQLATRSNNPATRTRAPQFGRSVAYDRTLFSMPYLGHIQLHILDARVARTNPLTSTESVPGVAPCVVFDNVLRTAYTHIYINVPRAMRASRTHPKKQLCTQCLPCAELGFRSVGLCVTAFLQASAPVYVVHARTPLRFFFVSVVFLGNGCRGDGPQFSATVRLQNRSPKPSTLTLDPTP